ncbi:TetR family transcriptional regulator [Virgisporangium aliadipatigenens]|uniref:TetR family transcriptional regulator n=1 Tax=Virgisporangium aliadipatigenens TaxID=741659 RepID=A0A8J3YFI0_9ACTN|nr:TetR/AcrR family transcriptional regulator [Virgisporangium aliadipatigenens]GIJ44209.1 TetR family transcriptional regulator [Virgisporangium aliadipatigenens]
MEDTRDQIRAAALELFVRQGYEVTSLREIADRVGITKASLYYHYPSKQALLTSIVDPLVKGWERLGAEVVALPQTPEHKRFALDAYLDMMLGHRAIVTLLMRDAGAVLAVFAPTVDNVTATVRQVQRWLAGPEPSGPDRIRAQVALDTIGVAMSSGSLLPEVTEDDLRTTLLDAACAVLRLPPPAGGAIGAPVPTVPSAPPVAPGVGGRR